MFSELVYDTNEIRAKCAERFPQAKFEDASDEVHENRFSIEGDIPKVEFYLFAYHEGFIGSCFQFLLQNSGMAKEMSQEWVAVFDALKSEIAKN